MSRSKSIRSYIFIVLKCCLTPTVFAAPKNQERQITEIPDFFAFAKEFTVGSGNSTPSFEWLWTSWRAEAFFIRISEDKQVCRLLVNYRSSANLKPSLSRKVIPRSFCDDLFRKIEVGDIKLLPRYISTNQLIFDGDAWQMKFNGKGSSTIWYRSVKVEKQLEEIGQSILKISNLNVRELEFDGQ